MRKRQTRDTAAAGKREAKYGVFISTHHKKNEKHAAPRKDDSRFEETAKNESSASPDWYTNIRACKECWKK